MTITETAKLLGVSPRTVERWTQQGMIHATWVQHATCRRHIAIEMAGLREALQLRYHIRAIVGRERAEQLLATLTGVLFAGAVRKALTRPDGEAVIAQALTSIRHRTAKAADTAGKDGG